MEKSSVIEFASGHGLRWEEEEEDSSRWRSQSWYFWTVDIGLESEWEEGADSVWGYLWGQHWRYRAQQIAKAVTWEQAWYVLEMEKVEG